MYTNKPNFLNDIQVGDVFHSKLPTGEDVTWRVIGKDDDLRATAEVPPVMKCHLAFIPDPPKSALEVK